MWSAKTEQIELRLGGGGGFFSFVLDRFVVQACLEELSCSCFHLPTAGVPGVCSGLRFLG